MHFQNLKLPLNTVSTMKKGVIYKVLGLVGKAKTQRTE